MLGEDVPAILRASGECAGLRTVRYSLEFNRRRKLECLRWLLETTCSARRRPRRGRVVRKPRFASYGNRSGGIDDRNFGAANRILGVARYPGKTTIVNHNKDGLGGNKEATPEAFELQLDELQ